MGEVGYGVYGSDVADEKVLDRGWVGVRHEEFCGYGGLCVDDGEGAEAQIIPVLGVAVEFWGGELIMEGGVIFFGDGGDVIGELSDDVVPGGLGIDVVGEGVVVVDQEIFDESGEAVEEAWRKMLFDGHARFGFEPEVYVHAVARVLPELLHIGECLVVLRRGNYVMCGTHWGNTFPFICAPPWLRNQHTLR